MRNVVQNLTTVEKSVDGVLGIRTWDHRQVGAGKSTELWRPPNLTILTKLVDTKQETLTIASLYS